GIPQDESVTLSKLANETKGEFVNKTQASYSLYMLNEYDVILESDGTYTYLGMHHSGFRMVWLNDYDTFDINDILSDVGQIGETSPSGEQNCLRLSNQQTLAFNTETREFEVLSFRRLNGAKHINLLMCYNYIPYSGLFFDV